MLENAVSYGNEALLTVTLCLTFNFKIGQRNLRAQSLKQFLTTDNFTELKLESQVAKVK